MSTTSAALLPLCGPEGYRIDRNAATVVVDPDAAIGQQRDRDARAEARHRLVDSVVDDLPDQVVEARQTGGPDVHSRPFSDRIETFQNLDVLCRVIGRWLVGVERHADLNLSAGKACLTCGYVGDTLGSGFSRRESPPSYRIGDTKASAALHGRMRPIRLTCEPIADRDSDDVAGQRRSQADPTHP